MRLDWWISQSGHEVSIVDAIDENGFIGVVLIELKADGSQDIEQLILFDELFKQPTKE